MNDRELLEAAAKAAGIDPCRLNGAWPVRCADPNDIWDPLIDDGDALRLAVKLRIDVKHYDYYVVAWFDGGYIGTGKIMCGDDPAAATRRSIVLAAAAMEGANHG